MNICSVCGYPAPDNYETCCGACADKLEVRNLEKSFNKRKLRKSGRETNKSVSEINAIVTENFAKVLLKNNIPCFTSNIDVDREICDQDAWFKKLNQSYRRRCITDVIEHVGYGRYSKANNGKSIYKRLEDPEVLRNKLQSIVSSGG